MVRLSGKTNARKVTNLAYRVGSGLSTSRFKRIANDLVLGPAQINVRRDESDYERLSDFEPVLRIALRKSGGRTSWSVYSRERNYMYPEDEDENPHTGVVLRHASFNWSLAGATRAWESQRIPDVDMETQYMGEEYSEKIRAACQPLDALVKHGVEMRNVPPEERQSNPSGWITLSMLRRIDDYEVEMSWGMESRSPKLEEEVFAVARIIEDMLKRHREQEPNVVEALEMVWVGLWDGNMSQETLELFDDDAPDDY